MTQLRTPPQAALVMAAAAWEGAEAQGAVSWRRRHGAVLVLVLVWGVEGAQGLGWLVGQGLCSGHVAPQGGLKRRDTQAQLWQVRQRRWQG